MRSSGPIDPDGNLQGLLLIAHPGLRDPNFRRTVLFLSAHEPEGGTFGLILNRPLDRFASQVLPDHPDQELLERVPVFLGGPVGQDQLSFADLRWDFEASRVLLNFNLSLEEVGERAERDPSGLRAFVGYAGWSAGQLQSELQQKAWVLTHPGQNSVTPPADARLWKTIISSLGPDYKLLSALPDDPSLN